MFCPKCSKQINDTAAFCPFCGEKIIHQAATHMPTGTTEQYGKKKRLYATVGIAAVICAVLLVFFLPRILPEETKDTDIVAEESVDNAAAQAGGAGSVAPAAESETAMPGEGAVPKEKASRTLMLYLCGSDLERQWGCATRDILEILSAKRGEHMNIVIQSGGTTEWHNDWMTDGTVQRFVVEGDSLTKLADFGGASMVRQESLTDFIEFSAAAYPADSYILILWDHGGGVPIHYGSDELDQGNNLTAIDIRDAIMDTGVQFETIAFDACLMGTLETALALKDCADFIIGAESTVVGTGMYYTNYVELLSTKEEVAPLDYCEMIVNDYMETVHKAGQSSSMSVIRTQHIQAVYDAYADYMRQALSEYNQGAYARYTQALEQCERYENPDCVDLSMLAQLFELQKPTAQTNEMSTAQPSDKLANAVNNAVAYTLSDYRPGRGITAYSPYKRLERYDQGRSLFTGLGYDESIITFYDQFVSDVASIKGGDVLETVQSCKWFTGASNATTQANTPGTTGASYALEVMDMGGYGAVRLPQNFVNVWTYVWMQGRSDNNKHQYRYYGRIATPDHRDNNGNLIFQSPDLWPMIIYEDGDTEYMDYDLIYYKVEGSYFVHRGRTPCKINGRSGYIYLTYNNEYNPRALVEGYVLSDFNGNEGDTMYALQEGDVITPLFRIYDTETNEMDYRPIRDAQYGKIIFSNTNFEEASDNWCLQYRIEDAYDNVFETEIYSHDAFRN